jgi:soluble lytic murein transglycosylase-like protein
VAPVKRAVILLAACAASPAAAQDAGPWRSYVEEASSRFGVPVAWIAHVMDAESGGRTRLDGRPIVSRAGAMGLMQLMPATWAILRARLRLGFDPHDPHDNVLAGTFYLRLMFDRFGYPGLAAAYNAGPARYADHLQSGRSLPAETRAYVAQVVRPRSSLAPAQPAAGSSGVFFPLAKPNPAGAETARTIHYLGR